MNDKFDFVYDLQDNERCTWREIAGAALDFFALAVGLVFFLVVMLCL